MNEISNLRVRTGLSRERPSNNGLSDDLYTKSLKEPLITKAYDAFRKQKSSFQKRAENLVPTEAYIEDQYKEILIDRAQRA